MGDRCNILILEFSPELEYSRAAASILESATGLAPISACIWEHAGMAPGAFEAAWRSGRFDGLILTAARVTPPLRDFWRRDFTRNCGPVILLAGEATHTEIIDLLKEGVSEVLLAPPAAASILPCVWRLFQRAAPDELGQKLKQELGLRRMVGVSGEFLAEVKKISLAARCDVTVLITGETGTGKELFARAIHYLSRRQEGPFTPVNCGAIPVELVENELFGHSTGAFTGANAPRAGMIEEAEGGTLFLDEIDCLPPAAQVKLLRLLQEKEYRPLGSAKTRIANVRVVSASNSDLDDAIQNGRLRRDLYYRLNVLPILLPPLRARREDIPVLARHFLSKFRTALNPRVQDFTAEALDALTRYDWPGNVRELEHAVERALVLCESDLIRPEHLSIAGQPERGPASFREAKARMIEQFEKTYLRRLLAKHGGNISEAARAARKNRRALFELLRKHNIRIEQFRAAAGAR